MEVESFSGLGKLFWSFPLFSLFNRNKSPFEVRLFNVVPLGDLGSVGCVVSEDVNTFSGVDKSDGPPFTSFVVELDLQVSLVSVGVLVPDGNVSVVVAVGTMLMEDEVWINAGLDEEVSSRGVSDGPSKVGLVSVGVLVPAGNWGVITSNSSLQVGNWSKLTLKEEWLSTLGKF